MANKFEFKKATRSGIFARVALIGPSGSGKSYKGLLLGEALKGDKRLAAIDTERGSLNRYASDFDFDCLALESFSPETYIEAMEAAASSGQYGALLVDSLSHAWIGKDGALEQVDKIAKRSGSGNSFMAWREVTPMHNRLVDTLLRMPIHLIVTVRSKTEYIMEENDRGKKVPKKVGMAPIQRDGLEYEFDIVGDLNLENEFIVSKTRATFLRGQIIPMTQTEKLGKSILAWCSEGGEPQLSQEPVKKEEPLIPVPPNDVVTQPQLDGLVKWCQENKIEREQVRKQANDLFGKPVSALTQDQYSDLRLELDKLVAVPQ